MVTLADHRRIQGLHTRARELTEDAERASDHIRRRHLMDLASAHEHVADAFEVRAEKKHRLREAPTR
jgi:hypothetical protein